MQARHADVVNADFRVGEAALLQPLTHDFLGKLCARQRVGTGVTDFTLADIAVVITNHHFVGWRARPCLCAGCDHPVLAFLFEIHTRDIEYAVGCDVAGRVMHLVKDLFGAGHRVEPSAGIVELAQHQAAVRSDISVWKADIDRIVAILFARINKAAAGYLCRAFHKMPGERAYSELVVIIVAPAQTVQHRAQKQ